MNPELGRLFLGDSLTGAHKALDIGLTAGAFIAAYFIKRLVLPSPLRGLTIEPNYYIVLLTVIIAWYLTFTSFNLYASYRRHTFSDIFLNVFKAVVTGMAILFVAMYIFKIANVSRLLLGIFFLLNIGLLATSKGIVYRVLNKYRKKGFNFRNVIIIGSRERAKDVINAVGFQLGAGFRVLGCLEIDPAKIGTKVKDGIRVIETVDSLKKILSEQVVDEIIFAMPLKKIASADQHIALAEEMGVSVRIIPDWQIHYLMSKPAKSIINFEDFLGIPSMALRTTPPAHAAILLKSVFDITIAGIFSSFFSPCFLSSDVRSRPFHRGRFFSSRSVAASTAGVLWFTNSGPWDRMRKAVLMK